MKLKSVMLLALALCLTLCLCACGGDTSTGDKSSESTSPASSADTTKSSAEGSTTATTTTVPSDTAVNTTASTQAQPVDGKVTYNVTVTDEAGNPIPGVFVQLCLDSCVPCITNAQGVATYSNMDVADYKVSFISIPEGYTSDVNEFHFAEGSYELTIVLKAAN